MMKKSLFLSMLTLMPSIDVVAQVDAFSVGGFNYQVTSETDKTVRFDRWLGGEGCANFEQLTHLVIPSTVTHEGQEYTITSIGEWTGDNMMRELTIPTTVTSIADYAFQGCENLQTIHFPASVDALQIGTGAFGGCTQLASFTLPEGLTSVGEEAFAATSYGNANTTVSIPASVTSFPNSVFNVWEGTASPLRYVVAEGNTVYESRSGHLVERATNTLVRACSGTVPEGVERIGGGAFYKLPVGDVAIPASVTQIHRSAFYGCVVRSYAVADGNTEYGVLSDQILYELATGTKIGFCSHTTIPDGTTNISYWFHWNLGCPQSITIPGSVQTMEMAFANSNVQEVVVSEGVTGISYSTFTGCQQLTSVTLPSSLRTIGYAAFEGCTNLESLIIPEGVTTIEGDCFDGCTSLGIITLPSTLVNLADQVFMGCTSLTEIVLPSKVVEIASKTFGECVNLTTITIPASVETVAADAFEGCENLTEIHLPANPEDIKFDVTVLPVSATLVYDVVNTEVENEVTVKLTATYGTFCSTSDLDFSAVQGLKAYIVSGYDDGAVLLTRVTNVPAGTGLVLVGTTGETYTIGEGNGRAVLSNLLVGVTEDTQLSKTDGDYTNYILAKGSDGTIGFHPLKSASSKLSAGRAYLPLPTWAVETAEGKARTFSICLDDGTELTEATGIGAMEVQRANDAEGDAVWHTLDGRQITGKPALGGIYIHKGKKTIILK